MAIFTYGSLLNERSALQTLSPETIKSFRPAVAYGAKRLFNRDMPEELIVSRFGYLVKPDNRGALNIQKTNNPNDRVNGVLFEVSIDELALLSKREIGYKLISITVSYWEDREAPQHFTAYTFSAGDENPCTSTEIFPIPGYYELVHEGAASYGQDFLEEYLQGTYLADGKTTIAEWEKNNKNFMRDHKALNER